MKSALTLVAALVLALGSPPRAAAAPGRPNVVLIVIESLRADHIGCYGYARATTPAMDGLASEGVRFGEAVSASNWTIPAVMSIMTSLPPALHGVTTHAHRLPDGMATLASELKKAGYQTAGIVANPMLHGRFGYSRGFDFYDDFTIILDVGMDLALPDAADKLVQQKVTGWQTTALARSWLKGKRDSSRPFFLFLFYFDPHWDYMPPPPYERMFKNPDYQGRQTGKDIPDLKGRALDRADKDQVAALYDGEVRYTDDQIGKLFEALKEQGLYDDSVLVVTGDHGEEFWDHGGVAHGHTMYEELIRVPLIVRSPKAAVRAGSVRTQVSHIDLMPTLLDLAGASVPTQCVGRSLAPMLAAPSSTFEAKPAFLESDAYSSHMEAVRMAGRKIVNGSADKPDRTEMYDLAGDPAEQRDLSGTPRAKEFDDLSRLFADWKSAMQARRGSVKSAPPAELDSRILQQLRSLKYVQ